MARSNKVDRLAESPSSDGCSRPPFQGEALGTSWKAKGQRGVPAAGQEALMAPRATALSSLRSTACNDVSDSSSSKYDPDDNSKCASYFVERKVQMLNQADLDALMVRHRIPPIM